MSIQLLDPCASIMSEFTFPMVHEKHVFDRFLRLENPLARRVGTNSHFMRTSMQRSSVTCLNIHENIVVYNDSGRAGHRRVFDGMLPVTCHCFAWPFCLHFAQLHPLTSSYWGCKVMQQVRAPVTSGQMVIQIGSVGLFGRRLVGSISKNPLDLLDRLAQDGGYTLVREVQCSGRPMIVGLWMCRRLVPEYV